MNRRLGAAPLVTALLLAAAACDGDGSAQPSPEPVRSGGTSATSSTTPPGTSSGSSTAQPSGGTAGGIRPDGGELTGLPTPAELAAATKDMGALSVRALAGQLVVARYSGTSPAGAAGTVKRLGLGGVAVFSDNVPASSRQVVPTMRAVATGVTAVMAKQRRGWPPFLAVDQEGGPIARLGSPLTPFPAAMALGATKDESLARSVGKASGDELRAAGFTVVLAPDADVTIGPADPTIGIRSPGSDPATVAAVSAGLVRGYLDAGLLPVAKHFPGHGSLTSDSHVRLPVQRRTLAALGTHDLIPFWRLVKDGAPALMTGHIVLAAMDSRPATVSSQVTTTLLRTTMGFRGLLVTDAMEMGAITGAYGSGKAAVLAVRAGADVVLMPADPKAAVDALVTAVGSGQLTRARLVESAARMVATLRHHTGPLPAAAVVGSHQVVAASLAAASVTQVSGVCGKRLVGTSISVSGALEADRTRFVAAARRAGLRTGSGTSVRLLGGGAYAAGSGSASGSEVGSGDVVVALDVPYGLARSRARVARLAAYGRSSATFDAVVSVLLGKAPARGRLPVAVGDWKVGSGCDG